MPEKRGQYQYNDDGTVSQLVTIAGADSTGGAVNTTTNDILPVDIQSRLSQTIQTHSGVTIPPTNGTSDSAFIDTDGFTEIGITINNDAGTSSILHIYWSNDGVNSQGAIYNAVTGTDNLKSFTIPTRARYLKIRLQNSDAAPHVMSAWVYLKV